ncbi:hypothetical protein HY091_01705 [Candidatus Kaiserbacteria bacterium]|nr:hypothetical protein [Candidatus Kaiserbacteria bacterium]
MQNFGFTLLETVITIALSTVMILILAGLAYNFSFVFSYQQNATQVAGGAGRVASETDALIRGASQVLSSHTIAGTTYTSGAGALVLALPSIDSSGAVIAGKSDYAVVYASSTSAYRLVAADAASSRVSGTKLLTNNLLALAFAFDNTDFTQVKGVGVDIKTETKTKQQTLDEHRYQVTYLRNH